MITYSFSGQTYQTGRLIGDIDGSATGPVLMLIAGIHGNEPSGVLALQQVFAELESEKTQLAGRLIGVTGNLNALALNTRYISQDLNRIWNRNFSDQFQTRLSSDGSDRLETGNSEYENADENAEQFELYELIEPLIGQSRPVYFIDLHTTSAPSVPFIAINDQLNNRNFALHFPVPTVLGIEEYLEGPLLSYLNDFGPVALAFEGGQHDDPESLNTHKSFIYRAMVTAGVISEAQIPGEASEKVLHQSRLEKLGASNHHFFEVIFRKPVEDDDEFKMAPGYRNLTPIKKGDILAHDRNGEIKAPMSGRIFMPLYQSSGNDGFFIVRKIPNWALWLSSFLRKINFERFLVCLPGVSRSVGDPHSLIVNKHVARFLAKQIFHLLGYRRKKEDGNVMIFSRREIGKP